MPVTLQLPQLAQSRPQRAEPVVPRPETPHAQRRLIDSHGRTIHDLRLSITDRCNFRCTYCMEPDHRFADRDTLLTVDELVRTARLCAGLGVRSIRLTGGEPTLHPQLEAIIARVAALPGVTDVSMTTNGSLIDHPRLAAWRAAGLRRLTFSLDGVSPESFARITRSSSTPEQVIAAIGAAQRAGLGPIKVNAVIVRGENEREIPALASLARDMGCEMRFIEFMPLDAGRHWNPQKLVPADEILARLSETTSLAPLGRADVSGTAELFAFADAPGSPARIGIIAPVTRPFCGQCSRLRITADGQVRPCLFSLSESDLRGPLRSGASDEMLEEVLLNATWHKQAGHGINSPAFAQPARTMSAIGG